MIDEPKTKEMDYRLDTLLEDSVLSNATTKQQHQDTSLSIREQFERAKLANIERERNEAAAEALKKRNDEVRRLANRMVLNLDSHETAINAFAAEISARTHKLSPRLQLSPIKRSADRSNRSVHHCFLRLPICCACHQHHHHRKELQVDVDP